MNILFITHQDNYYGSSRSLMSLIHGLLEMGYRPFVVTPQENRFTEALNNDGIPYKVIPLEWWVSRKTLNISQKGKWIRKLKTSIRELKQVVTDWHIDLIYTNTTVIPAGRVAALLLKKPHVWHIREFGDLDFSLEFIFPRRLSLRIISSSQAVICNSKAVLYHKFTGESKNIHLVYNGSVTRHEYDGLLKQRSDRSPNDLFTFAIVSNITPKKGQEQAIRAIADLKKMGINARLIVAGHGNQDYIRACENLAEEMCVADEVILSGFVEDPYSIYLSADCILICSENEALSRVALEAMACAVPVIARNSGGNPEIFTHENTGLLYENLDDLVRNMALAVNHPDWIRQIGLAGWSSAKEKFNIENYACQIDNIIKSIIKEK